MVGRDAVAEEREHAGARDRHDRVRLFAQGREVRREPDVG